MRKIFLFVFVLLVCISLSACGKSLDERVTQKKESVEVGAQVNLVDLFECEEGVSVGVKNANSFDVNKVGSYSIDMTIMDKKEEVDKSFIIKVTDEKAPEITAKEEVVLYEKDKFDPMTYASVTDNSKENVALEVAENNVDVKKAGEYSIKYQAKDSSGNTAEKTMKVVVKKVYSFSERKKLAKKIIKDGKYKHLTIDEDKNKKLIWVNAPLFKETKKTNFAYVFLPYLVIANENKKIETSLYVHVEEVDSKNYLSPKSMYIRSDKGTISTDVNSVYFDYDYGYDYEYTTKIDFYYSNTKDLDKLYNMINGDYLKFKVYTDKKNFSYKCKKKEINTMKELMGFYNDIKAYL